MLASDAALIRLLPQEDSRQLDEALQQQRELQAALRSAQEESAAVAAQLEEARAAAHQVRWRPPAAATRLPLLPPRLLAALAARLAHLRA